MRAAVLHTLGQPPARRPTTPTRSPAPGQTLVRVTAAPVVPLDLLCASGHVVLRRAGRAPTSPACRGSASSSSPSGRRSRAPGSGSPPRPGWRPGDGGLAELVRRSPTTTSCRSQPSRSPTPRSPPSASPPSRPGCALTWQARLQPGERVLVLGGGGAVGQVGHRRGHGCSAPASVVAVVPLPGRSRQRARAAGADEVVPLTEDADEPWPRACARRPAGRSTWSSTRSSVPAADGRLPGAGRRRPAGEPRRRRRATRRAFSSALLRSRSLEVLGYTNNALTVEQRRAAVVGDRRPRRGRCARRGARGAPAQRDRGRLAPAGSRRRLGEVRAQP